MPQEPPKTANFSYRYEKLGPRRANFSYGYEKLGVLGGSGGILGTLGSP